MCFQNIIVKYSKFLKNIRCLVFICDKIYIDRMYIQIVFEKEKAMFEFKHMNDLLKPYCIGDSLFDYYRLVDPKTHEVFEYDNENNLIKNELSCYKFWDKKKECANCVANHCYVKQRQYVKLEFVHGKVMFIISKPIKIQEKMFALELIKDITSSMVGYNYYRSQNNNVENIISQFNELAIRDIVTGLYNLDFIKNYIDDFLEKEAVFNTLGAIAIDVDNYTEINSLYGYNVGNEVLQYIAGKLEKCGISYGGVASRLGPDEMGIFFINKTIEELEEICEEAYNEVTTSSLDVKDKKLNVEFTYAVAMLDNKDDSDDFIGRLYFNLRMAQGKKQSK